MSEEISPVATVAVPPPPPAQIGSLSIHDGKATIMLRNGPVPFDVDYVCNEMKKRIKGTRGFYTNHVRIIITKLRLGEADVQKAISTMNIFSRDPNPSTKRLYSGLTQLLSTFDMVYRINTKKPDEVAPTTTLQPEVELI